MKPVHQTVFGEDSGNCWSACIASILELPIEDVPNFCGDPPRNKDWFFDTHKWLQPMGLSIINVNICSGIEFGIANGVYLIAEGNSPRGDFIHCVVARVDNEQWTIAHDPHPSGDGIDGTWKFVSFLVKY